MLYKYFIKTLTSVYVLNTFFFKSFFLLFHLPTHSLFLLWTLKRVKGREKGSNEGVREEEAIEEKKIFKNKLKNTVIM